MPKRCRNRIKRIVKAEQEEILFQKEGALRTNGVSLIIVNLSVFDRFFLQDFTSYDIKFSEGQIDLGILDFAFNKRMNRNIH